LPFRKLRSAVCAGNLNDANARHKTRTARVTERSLILCQYAAFAFEKSAIPIPIQ